MTQPNAQILHRTFEPEDWTAPMIIVHNKTVAGAGYVRDGQPGDKQKEFNVRIRLRSPESDALRGYSDLWFSRDGLSKVGPGTFEVRYGPKPYGMTDSQLKRLEAQGTWEPVVESDPGPAPAPPQSLAGEAAAIRAERAAVYGKGHYNHGAVLAALYPGGLFLKTKEDFTRFVTFNNLLTKVVRYGLLFTQGGHRDSAIDAGNYAHLLAELDDEISNHGR
jgi:hypothetical protein